MKLNRRNVLQLAGGTIAASALLSDCGGAPYDSASGLGSSTGAQLSSEGTAPKPFDVPLPLPPVLNPVRSDAANDYYEITETVASAQIVPGRKTEIWGYNGSFPGPTLVTRRGRRAVVVHRNELPVPVVVHLHGAKTPPGDDGYPTDLVLPYGHGDMPSMHGDHHQMSGGQISHATRTYQYPLDQPAATLWYHDHRMDFTGPQVYKGLAGFHLHHDDDEQSLPLPKDERDIPLMICDRAFAEDGSFRYPAIDPSLQAQPGVTERYMQGVLGDTILVNGAPWPVLDVTNTRYRFRILNASNARRYRLTLDPAPREGAAFTQIGSDAGLLGRPVSHDHIDIAQAERFDVIVDFASYPVGTAITLRNEFGDGPTAQVMRFRVTRTATDDSAVPQRLVDFEPLSRSAATVTRSFDFDQRRDGWAINGHTFDPNRIEAQPQLGATEIWRLNTDAHHPIHLHLAHFQVLTRNGRPPGRLEGGWKDTVDVPTGVETEIIARFTGYRGRFVFHCHNLEHEDMAMMANMQIV